jgi:DNA-directed RNA polymerase specialized sigma24 family protein
LVRGAEFDGLDVARVQAFLTRLVTRLCVDETRHKAVVARMAVHPKLTPVPAQDVADAVCDHDEAQWLAKRMRSLSIRDQRLISMLSNGRTHKDIAAELRSTPHSTHVALYRIRKKIVQHCR